MGVFEDKLSAIEKLIAVGLAEENVRFNFAQFIELGDSVFFNRGVFLDSKGGIVC
ncbi:MAG: hypothetical protein P4L55_16120 [Syntrophobacteraceae bacterium]|nr:hypothetical protein [Syntrophobacteraceae bacterium]